MTVPKVWRTVPICDPCWDKEVPFRDPVRFKWDMRVKEKCYRCGVVTLSGIYVRREVEVNA